MRLVPSCELVPEAAAARHDVERLLEAVEFGPRRRVAGEADQAEALPTVASTYVPRAGVKKVSRESYVNDGVRPPIQDSLR